MSCEERRILPTHPGRQRAMNTDFSTVGGRFTLRPEIAGDEGFLYRVYASTRMDEMALVDWTAEQKEAFLQMQFNAQTKHYRLNYPEADYQIIQLEGLPAGRIIVDRSGEPILLIDIALLPEFRNGGIGTILIKDLMDEAAGLGRSICLHVEMFNPARKLYDRLGFVKKDEQGIYHELVWPDACETTSNNAVSIPT